MDASDDSAETMTLSKATAYPDATGVVCFLMEFPECCWPGGTRPVALLDAFFAVYAEAAAVVVAKTARVTT